MIDSVEVDQMERKLDGEERAPDKNLAWAIGIAVTLALVWSLLPGQPDVAVIAQVTEEVTERACIAQYGPGERFTKPMQCALGTRDVPATALSYPLAEAK